MGILNCIRRAGVLALLPLVMLVAACSSMDPMDYQIEPPLDLLTEPNPKAPSEYGPSTLVLLPARNSAASTWNGLANQLAADIRDTIHNNSNVEFRAQGRDMDAIVQELARQGTALYSPEGTVELGRIANAQFVLTFELTSASASRESYWVEVLDWDGPRDKNGNLQVKRERRWKVQADTSASLQLVSVETGRVEWSINRSAHDMEDLHDRDPGETGAANLARRVAETLVPDLVSGVIKKFPLEGYISELRGSQRFALIDFAGRRVEAGALVSAIGTQVVNDPVKGIHNVDVSVCTLRTLYAENRGTWAYNMGAQGVLRRGMRVVVTGVVERDAGTSDFGRILGKIFR